MTETLDAKQKLAEMIEAYATAKGSNNEMLIRMAIANLQSFLQSVDVVPVAAPEEETSEG